MMAVAELFFQRRIRRIQTLNGEKSRLRSTPSMSVMASLEKSRNSHQIGGRHGSSFHASL